MQKRRYILIFLFLGNLVLAQEKENQNETKLKNIDQLVTGMNSLKGLITTHLNDNNTLYFELTDGILNKELLVVTRIVQLPANYSDFINAGSKTSERVIVFDKLGNKILIKELSYAAISDESDPIHLSVNKNNYPPILAAFEIMNKESNRYLIDVSSYFKDDSPGFNIIRSNEKDKYKIGTVEKSRSFIERANSYRKNTEILHTLTFNAQNPPPGNQAKSLSFQINHSIIKLPEIPMPVRYADPRVGWFTLNKTDYSSEELKSDEYKIVRRWRLEPKDKDLYLKGELVEPIKPIVYYLDPATPMKWRKYFKLGIEDWNQAFEKAGFKNAIVAKDPPTPEEDPEFNPEDIRYSTVRYVASTTRNAVGPSVSDPRTGEILESDIIWYHNHLRSYRNRYLLETAAANPKARGLDTPEEEIGEMMRRVISHEVGHALGLPHNMKASSAYPVDSLRSGSFTQKYGIATTIMDYARYNYVAQPGDQNIRFVRQLGPYDDYAIAWGYRYFDKSPSEEFELLRKIVDEKSLDPLYMFGGRGNDPNAQTENIGDDPVKASIYGIKNLKIVALNLVNWTVEPNGTYDDLEELYGELLGVYERYVYHCLNLIGGVYKTPHNNNQKGVTTYVNVSKEKQTNALIFLDTYFWKTQNWLLPKNVISQFKEEGALLELQNIQLRALNRILNVQKLNNILSVQNTLEGNGIGVDELMAHLTNSFLSLEDSDVIGQNLQLSFVAILKSLLLDKDLSPSIKAHLVFALEKVAIYSKKKSKTTSLKLKPHYLYLMMSSKIDSKLNHAIK